MTFNTTASGHVKVESARDDRHIVVGCDARTMAFPSWKTVLTSQLKRERKVTSVFLYVESPSVLIFSHAIANTFRLL